MSNKKTLVRSAIAALTAAGAIGAGAAASAAAAEFADLEVSLKRSHLEPSLKAAELRQDYEQAFEKAKKLDAEPNKNVAADEQAGKAKLERELDDLRKRVRKAEREPKIGSPQSVGVSPATLESIAACESGGDPTAVSSGGDYRGKYQFDYGTWAAVGGSGDPAAAPEAEQDYRAALLYSRSGSSPWPVCGS